MTDLAGRLTDAKFVPHPALTDGAVAQMAALEALVVRLWMMPGGSCNDPDEVCGGDCLPDQRLSLVEMELLKGVLLRAGFCEWCWVGPYDECRPECEGER